MRMTWHTAALELAEPLRISRSVMSRREAVRVTVEHDGLRGHGEAVSSAYRGLPARRITAHLARLRGALERYPDPETAWAGPLPGGLPAGVSAAIEAAVLDLVGKRAGRPAHRVLGTVLPPAAETARTIGIVAPVRAAATAGRLARAGFGVLKVKAGSADPARDLARVGAVRAAAPGARLLLDPNGAWSEERARGLLPAFAALGVEAVEQPVAPGRPEVLARVARDSPLPVIADEDAVSYEDAMRLAGRVHGVNVKLAECGGVRAALRICAALEGSGTEVMLGCLAASSLGIAPAVHLVDRARWVDLDGHLLLAADPWTGIGGADGTVRASPRPGLGVRPSRGRPAAT
ncbi:MULTISPECIES: enolase C-terminal domain-like protein [unclassified Streptomyces]|uniref:enolase C-terminal domain-like protein n=1 Tax=unclassified Streptomyces TaxID=2593676 RepID=UPI002E128435|nr:MULTISPECIES: enolase C-terminal domain-like protein [unclassified Streptomyces]WSR24783.1 dipeptide epimerase [Streptomyces sp. NBC_01205]